MASRQDGLQRRGALVDRDQHQGRVGADMCRRQPQKSGGALIRPRRHHGAAGGTIADGAPEGARIDDAVGRLDGFGHEPNVILRT